MTQHDADTIFVGDNILTQAADQGASTGPVRAMAVRDGIIVAIGGDEVLDLRGSATEMVDLGSRCLLPGFIDSHIHPVTGGLARQQCDLSGVHSMKEYRALIAEYAARHNGPWIEGAGWYGDIFEGGFPTKGLLDEIVSDRPAALASHDVHSLWVNSHALEIAGIDATTPDPEGGRISRNPDGEPTGQLMENAIDLLAPYRPAIGPDVVRRSLVAAEAYLHSLGITSWQDAMIGEVFGSADTYDTYIAAYEAGLVRSRVTGALLWHPQNDPEDLSEAMRRRAATTGGRFRTTAIKFLLDGNCENLTAALHEAYAGHPNEFGMLQFDDRQLCLAARHLSDSGFDLHMHAVGDLAVTQALDAIAAIPDRSDRRHQVAHIDLINAEDVTQMRELDVMANVTPLWARLDPVLVETKLPLLTSSQQKRHFLYGSLDRAGVEVAFGSDWPVSTPDPIANLHTAVNRTAAPGDPHASERRSLTQPLLKGERLSVETSLAAYTRLAAKASRLDDYVGTLEAGKEADLVVLDRNPRSLPASDVGGLNVTETFVHGDRVFAL